MGGTKKPQEQVLADGELEMSRGISFILALMISSPAMATVSRDCSDRKAVNDMISELQDSFECAGLSAVDCKRLMGGTAVGGALAARIAIGLRTLRKTPLPPECLGNISKTAFNTEDGAPSWFLFSSPAYAANPQGSFLGCSLDRNRFGRDLGNLVHEYRNEASEIRRAMALRLAEDALNKDLSKVTVTGQEVQKATLAKLKEFQKAIENPVVGKQLMGGDSVKWQMIRDVTKTQIEILANETDNLINAATSANERIFFQIPEETRAAWEKKFTVTQTIHEQTNLILQKEYSPKAQKAYEKALEHLNNSTWERDKHTYFKNLGYSEDAVNQVMSSERTVKDLTSTRQLIQHAQTRLSVDPEYRKLSTLNATNIHDFMKKYLPQIGHRLPITHMAEVPGAATRLQAKIMAMGRAQLASMGNQATNLKNGMSLFARAGTNTGRFVLGAGGTMITFAGFAAECQNMGELQVSYVTQEVGPAGGCVPSSQRTESTDAFLFGLNSEEQWQMVQEPLRCTMLNRVHERYAPSRQWNVQCPTTGDGEVVLEPKFENPNQPRIRFRSKQDGEPNQVDWNIPAQSMCVLIKDGKADPLQVFTTKSKDQKTCELMSAGSMDSYQPPSRPTDRKFAREFANTADEWIKTNSYTFTMAKGCCSGTPSVLCPSKNKSTGSGDSQTQTK